MLESVLVIGGEVIVVEEDSVDGFEIELVEVSTAIKRSVLDVSKIDLVKSSENGFADGPSCARMVYLIHLLSVSPLYSFSVCEHLPAVFLNTACNPIPEPLRNLSPGLGSAEFPFVKTR
jgi:hypothetical protein